MPKITAIEIENFQSIGKPTIIPIRDLTLMFGPNGAGKSAVFDALTLLTVLLGDDWGPASKNLCSLLERNSRNFTQKNAPGLLGLGVQVHIEAGWKHDDLDWPSWNMTHVNVKGVSNGGDYAHHFCDRTLRFHVGFKADIGESCEWFISSLDLGIDDELILSMRGNYRSGQVFLHKKDWIDLNILESLPQSIEGIHWQEGIVEGPVESGFSSAKSQAWFDRTWTSDRHTELEFMRIVQELIDFFRSIILENIRDVSIVQGSRVVPSVAESVAIVRGDGVTRHDGQMILPVKLDGSSLFGTIVPTLNKCDPIWLELCKAVVRSNGAESPDGDEDWWELSTIDRVNSLLREELFLENAYQVRGEVYCIAGLDRSGEFQSEYTEPWPKLVRLYLIDHEQRVLEFQDVGSGIGYVLPVLASLASNDTSLIQQPELHLHPALQSKLGDVIVKCVENKSYLRSFTLIETHSEHLLLRVMRLLKSAREREDEVLNPLSHEQVGVLYFDPQPSGETRVKRLRLAPDGQLIDRWPGGFFNERLRDIFDE